MVAYVWGMKKYRVKWGNWDSSVADVPANNIAHAIQEAIRSYGILLDQINSVTLLGDW